MAKSKGMIVIHENRCKGCQLCVSVCPTDMLELASDRFNTLGYRPIQVCKEDVCTGCGICAVICPDVVFTVYRQKKQPKRKPAAG